MQYKNLVELINVVEVLRSETGCAWDREQTHTSLKKNMLEEAYETVDAIDSSDMKHLREELGDVLLQVILHAQIAKESGDFCIEDVSKTIKDKLIHRHPHVFGDVKVHSTDEILDNWEELKKKEKPHRTSIMDGISKAQSALMTAQKASKKAIKVGFEWPNEEMLRECIYSELDEFKNAKTPEEKEDELGDILFAIVNLARWNNINAEEALIKSNRKFIARFKMMEKLATKDLTEYNFEEYDALWRSAKEALSIEDKTR